MLKLIKTGQAGTMESNDIMITIAPAEPGAGVNIHLTSPVLIKYGRQIKAVIASVLAEAGVTDAQVTANDKGALDCTVRARMEAALGRTQG